MGRLLSIGTPLYGARTSIPTLVTNFIATTAGVTGNGTYVVSENDDFDVLDDVDDCRFVASFYC